MNLICITESELSQWVSRRYLDTLTARVLTDRESLAPEIFYTAPFLKIDDARGRIVVNLKGNWKELSQPIHNSADIDAMSIPLDAVLEIAPSMDQYGKRLAVYQLRIAEWSVEKIWDVWLINQAVMETRRAIVDVIGRNGYFDKYFINNKNLINAVIEKSLRPKVVFGGESLLRGWANVLENRDTWLQWLRTEGHLDNKSMLKASADKITEAIGYQSSNFSFLVDAEDGGWKLEDITPEILHQFTNFDAENLQKSDTFFPPIFCVVAYLRLYDEIHNGDKDWRVVFNILEFIKYSVSSMDADISTVALLASLNVDEIYKLESIFLHL